MKVYERVVLWLEYFNSSLSRKQGRRVPLDRSVRNPTLQELVQAAAAAGYDPKLVNASHPKRSKVSSGYVSVTKRQHKEDIIREVSLTLSRIRGAQRESGVN